jgi:hypothetical protein
MIEGSKSAKAAEIFDLVVRLAAGAERELIKETKNRGKVSSSQTLN